MQKQHLQTPDGSKVPLKQHLWTQPPASPRNQAPSLQDRGTELQDPQLLDKSLTGPIPGDRLTSKKSDGRGPDGNP